MKVKVQRKKKKGGAKILKNKTVFYIPPIATKSSTTKCNIFCKNMVYQLEIHPDISYRALWNDDIN